MDYSTTPFTNEEAKELLEAQVHIWKHIFYYLNSMALKCALHLGIPDTIQKHGKPMTLSELATSLPIHKDKVTSLNRLMRILVSSNFFTKKKLLDNDDTNEEEEEEEGYSLTLNSQLLLKDHPLTLAPFAFMLLEPVVTNPSHNLTSWFQSDAESSFHLTNNGKSFWDHTGYEPKFNEYFNLAMESDSRFVTRLLVTNPKFKALFEGIQTLVDVGGGNGTTVEAIAEAYPWLKCTVLDLPHVVQGLQLNSSNHVNFVAGDMFQAVPSANAVLLKWILHDWSDDDCIKILRQCKEAIPSKSEGGKVIIIDIVVDSKSKHSNADFLFDMLMMSLFGDGKERTEQQFNKLFNKAGFSDYNIFPILGVRSVIELYP